MNYQHIKTFIAVYRAGSFVDVANELNVAPSSISRTIASLEESLKTRLFQRSTRQLTATQEGEAYFNKIVPLIEEWELAHQSLTDNTSTPSGLLRVTASTSYGQIVLAPQLKQFRDKYPNIELELILSDGQIDLINNQIDVAIRHGSLLDSSLVARKLADVRYHLVASKKYIDEFGTANSLDELKDHDLISFSYSQFRHRWVFSHNKGDEQKSLDINPVLTATNASTIRECARNGMGIALLADWTVQGDLNSGRLIKLLPEWKVRGESSGTSISLIYPSGRFIPAKTRAFVDFFSP